MANEAPPTISSNLKPLTTAEVCAIFGICRTTLTLWRTRGRISGFQPGGGYGHWRYLRSEVRRVMEAERPK